MARRRFKLNTIGHVLVELGRQYRRADAGELTWSDAAAAARILREMRQAMEASDIEARIAALEEKAGFTTPGRPNGETRPGACRW